MIAVDVVLVLVPVEGVAAVDRRRPMIADADFRGACDVLVCACGPGTKAEHVLVDAPRSTPCSNKMPEAVRRRSRGLRRRADDDTVLLCPISTNAMQNLLDVMGAA